MKSKWSLICLVDFSIFPTGPDNGLCNRAKPGSRTLTIQRRAIRETSRRDCLCETRRCLWPRRKRLPGRCRPRHPAAVTTSGTSVARVAYRCEPADPMPILPVPVLWPADSGKSFWPRRNLQNQKQPYNDARIRSPSVTDTEILPTVCSEFSGSMGITDSSTVLYFAIQIEGNDGDTAFL